MARAQTSLSRDSLTGHEPNPPHPGRGPHRHRPRHHPGRPRARRRLRLHPPPFPAPRSVSPPTGPPAARTPGGSPRPGPTRRRAGGPRPCTSPSPAASATPSPPTATAASSSPASPPAPSRTANSAPATRAAPAPRAYRSSTAPDHRTHTAGRPVSTSPQVRQSRAPSCGNPLALAPPVRAAQMTPAAGQGGHNIHIFPAYRSTPALRCADERAGADRTAHHAPARALRRALLGTSVLTTDIIAARGDRSTRSSPHPLSYRAVI